MQQRLCMQDEALEMEMKLEASLIAKTSAGMTNLQNQLANLTLQLHKIKKGKEVAQELWCTKCKGHSHTKDNCPVFVEYLESGDPNPLVQTQGPWCEICRTRGHRPQECPLLQKYVQTPKNLYCNFCKSVGHDENNCRAYDLMIERKHDFYRVQSKTSGPVVGPQHELAHGGRGGGFRGRDRGGGFGRGH